MSVKKKIVITLIQAAAIFIIIALPLASAGFSGFLILKTYNVSKIIAKTDYLDKVGNNADQEEGYSVKAKARELILQTGQLMGAGEPKLKWGREDRVNILLLGKASEDYPGSGLTDTVILASFNPKTNETAMLSIPRDLYAQIPGTNQYTKLNAIYYYGTRNGGEKGGIKYISKAVKEITGQQVDYFVMLDFKGFVKLVDEIGGIRINVTQELTDTRYPGPNYSYETFHIDKGWQQLDGATALKYVRTRHNSGGDFGRAYRQQQVLGAIKKRFFSMEGVSLLGKFNAILDIISQNVVTDIEFGEYGSFLALAKNVNEHNTVNKVLDNRGEDPILVSYSPRFRGQRAYFLRPATGDYSRIQEIAENIFDLEKLQKTYEKRREENPSVLLLNQSGNRSLAAAVKKRLSEAGFSKVSEGTGEEEVREKTIVYSNHANLKPYSFDFLVKLLKAEARIEENPRGENFDLVVVLGDDAQAFLAEDEVVLPEGSLRQEEY